MGFESDSVLPDPDPISTREWIDSILAVQGQQGNEEARRLLLATIAAAKSAGVDIDAINTPYLNTISPTNQGSYPGNLEMEKRLHEVIRWNAMMIVTRANKYFEGIGGHISTYASTSHAWETGFNHFFRGKDGDGSGDHVYWQGHASPGVYARAWLEGRLSKDEIEMFRQETGGKGLSSYPHPRLMPNFWEFPSVSMGLGGMTAIHQARFNRYLESRGLCNTTGSRVWYTMGDGESDEPESLSQLSLAAREGLDNIIMTMNCNLQRLDGPVRGNSKIVQELEGRFRGAGWNVIKVLWGSSWDDLFSRDSQGILAARLNSLVDGDEQRIMTAGGSIIRKDLFNTPELSEMVSQYTDEDLEKLCEDVGGHDFVKLHAAYAQATAHKGQPTAVIIRTIKGYGLGPAFAGKNTTHQKKKADIESMKFMRDDMNLSFSDEDLETYPFINPEDVPELVEYAKSRREVLHGYVPERRSPKSNLTMPSSDVYSDFDDGTKGKMQVSTTMAFVRLLRGLMKSKELGPTIVPIIPDEARTFGMDPLFSEFGIYHPEGQLYTPVDHKVIMKYKESEAGQLFEEGINEAGATSTFIASATSYSTHSCPTIPFYIFYSMFGFQRVADLIWSAADQRARGFLMGATSGRTTLNGEGLQHQDGHSLLMAHTNPSVRAWDPAFAYELATIIQHGIKEMFEQDIDVMYYIAVYNENYPMPAKPKNVDEGIIRGLYKLRGAPKGDGPIVRLLGSGPIMLQVLDAVEKLEEFGIRSEIWSATSYGELRRDGLECERWNRLNPSEPEKQSWVQQMLGSTKDPIIAVSDNMAAVPDMVRQWMPNDFTVLGTDGFGRSDTREALRRFFEIDGESITLAAISRLVRNNIIDSKVYDKAVKKFKVSSQRNDITEI
ncbi:MAG: pyruvate dehydrogenase (acetyl-transferring), homodimeric type [Euryarchaeota archaeon]|nr:pyruvate dehydrogenase (acetyl-transferring), homodimeric type [Euryarchaeota archaeon]MBT4925547.1 pyruvate dehydrogenase (acetyl-transferring), homodimeric type [Euryarchaeota archaeon]MBT5736031.1 pyruvate dehydrogenase (acetyl-transferring), homodimeric type [Euryarchaeota archaeon]